MAQQQGAIGHPKKSKKKANWKLSPPVAEDNCCHL